MLPYIYHLKDYKESLPFEREFPRELRWDDRFKLYQLTNKNMDCCGIWTRGKEGLVAEAILLWESENVLHLRSLVVLPAHRGKDYGHDMLRKVFGYAEREGFGTLTAIVSPGAAAKIFKNFNGVPMLDYVNYKGSGQTYTSYKINI